MDDVYTRLARKLDRLPQGFPPSPSGVEQRILRKLFSPLDAAWALQIKPFPETASTVAHRLGQPLAEVQSRLDDMAARGLIGAFRQDGTLCFALVPFVIGIYEFQVGRLDLELAEMVEEYLPSLLQDLGGRQPALARVIPIGTHIEARAQVLPYDDLRAAIDRAGAFRVSPCICREEQAWLGHPCHHPAETCMSMAKEPDAYLDVPGWGRIISRQEAHAVLDLAEGEGLVHCTYNAQGNPFFVCNCCSCCCGFLRGVREFGAPQMLVRSNYAARIAPEKCSGCGLCATERCPMSAIVENGKVYAVSTDRCIGCGVCAITCPSEAIDMVPRPQADRSVPPRSIVHWSIARITQRDGRARALAVAAWVAWQAARMKIRSWRTAS